MSANPGGLGHQFLAARYVFTNAAPWTPFLEPKSKRQWVYAPSTFAGNNLIDIDQYSDQLHSSCPDDPELLRAWVEGDWSVVRGAYFASCLSEERNAIAPWKALLDADSGWDVYLAHDWGSAAPSVTLLCLESSGASHEGRFYPRGSIVLVDELVAHKKGNLSVGLGWNVAMTAEAIRRDLCAKWDCAAIGVADDACFAKQGASAGSLADEFATGGVYFSPAGKGDRISGWMVMRRLLSDAGRMDRAGLYISRECSYWWNTVPIVPRSDKRIEDIDTQANDHSSDTTRYSVMRSKLATELHVGWAS